MAHDGLTTSSARSLGLVERLPVRRIILTILTVAVVTFVVVGTYKTLTLSGADHLGWAFWANLFVIGLALGAVYALIALGYTLVYGILRMINFAHGEVFMWGAFGSYFFATAYAKSGFLNSNPWASLAILFVSAIAVSSASRSCSSGSPTGRCATRRAWCPSSRRSAPRCSCRTRRRASSVRRRGATRARRSSTGTITKWERELRQDRSHRDRRPRSW